ncbi:MAG: C_GCAxxG_C_C family protein [Candidatus Methanomethylophilaceae archaeon]|nr:C_GCAxxG_C_C family protein [Candidatus Methanomethylophilaceae archaeon]
MLTEMEVDRLFKQGFDRSQIVLGAVSERLGMTKEQAYAVVSCFGIGMAQRGMCGAASGEIMALGLRYGNAEPGDLMTKSQVFAKRDEFLRRFAEMNGKTSCPELLGRRVDTFDEIMMLGATDLFRKSPGYCVNAIRILEDMM